MTHYATILIVDDDQQICDLLEDFLTQHGYQVLMAHDEKTMLNIINAKKFDLLILDIMLPGTDGLTLCRQVREKSNLPIIIISALGAETDRIVGLEIGADDYIPKPFNPHELLARIKALLRRTTQFVQQPDKTRSPVRIRFADWILDQQQRCLIAANGLKIPLSSSEFDLLMVFIEHANQILNRDQLLDSTKGKEYLVFDRSIDVQVGRLRKKLNEDPKHPRIIVTVRNAGYRFMPKVEYL